MVQHVSEHQLDFVVRFSQRPEAGVGIGPLVVRAGDLNRRLLGCCAHRVEDAERDAVLCHGNIRIGELAAFRATAASRVTAAARSATAAATGNVTATTTASGAATARSTTAARGTTTASGATTAATGNVTAATASSGIGGRARDGGKQQ
jgi:hypothetical protein